MSQGYPFSRRKFIAATAGLPLFATCSVSARPSPIRHFELLAAPGRVRLVPEPHGKTNAWCFNGTVPGPEIRVRQGDRLRINAGNALDEETTVHCHGIRLPNNMDGVPHLTQRPIGPGETFTYEFDAIDAGTFWYHPHQRSFEQVGRGLYGPLIIEEAEPIRVDRDITWMLDDWRLTNEAQISDDFGNGRDFSHNGRIGNSVTINGWIPDKFRVRKGERIRLRLINAANARIFALDFKDHGPMVIALDGQPVKPHLPDGSLVVLGPAMRADIILDCHGEPGTEVSIIDRFYEGRDYRLVDLDYDPAPLRAAVPGWPMALPENLLSQPRPEEAIRHEVIFNGGMMGGDIMRDMGASMPGNMRERLHSGKIWFINGVAATSHMMEPMLTLARNRTHLIALTNATAWHHPIHLHGHSFRVLSRNGQATKHRPWQDTVLMSPREKVEIAFVADNPGDWMFHCHILEHQAAGMMGVIRVTEHEVPP